MWLKACFPLFRYRSRITALLSSTVMSPYCMYVDILHRYTCLSRPGKYRPLTHTTSTRVSFSPHPPSRQCSQCVVSAPLRAPPSPPQPPPPSPPESVVFAAAVLHFLPLWLALSDHIQLELQYCCLQSEHLNFCIPAIPQWHIVMSRDCWGGCSSSWAEGGDPPAGSSPPAGSGGRRRIVVIFIQELYFWTAQVKVLRRFQLDRPARS